MARCSTIGRTSTSGISLAEKRHLENVLSYCMQTLRAQPRPGEILMAIVIADGGRPVPRLGKTRAAL